MALDTGKYKDIYINKARKHLSAMNKSLLKLEKNPDKVNFVNDTFRAAHTLKSESAMMGYEKTANLCHAMEDALAGVKKKKIKPAQCVDILFECVDAVELSLREIAEKGTEPDTADLVQELREEMKHKSEEVRANIIK